MPARAYWKGHLRLSLVSFPVRLHPAVSSSAKVQLHQIHKTTGERVHYQKFVPDIGPVENEDIVKGYEYEKDRYVTIEPEELEQIRLESKHTIDIVQFVDAEEVDPVYYERSYFVLPDGEFAVEPFRVVRDALRDTGKVALGQVVLSGAEHLVALRPKGRGMIMETLRYASQVRRAETYFEEIGEGEADPEQIELAKQIIRSRSAPFEPARFKDHYQSALRELVGEKLRGAPPQLEAAPQPPRVVNLMDALRRSVAELAEKQAPAPRTPQEQPAEEEEEEERRPRRGRRKAS